MTWPFRLGRWNLLGGGSKGVAIEPGDSSASGERHFGRRGARIAMSGGVPRRTCAELAPIPILGRFTWSRVRVGESKTHAELGIFSTCLASIASPSITRHALRPTHPPVSRICVSCTPASRKHFPRAWRGLKSTPPIYHKKPTCRPFLSHIVLPRERERLRCDRAPSAADEPGRDAKPDPDAPLRARRADGVGGSARDTFSKKPRGGSSSVPPINTCVLVDADKSYAIFASDQHRPPTTNITNRGRRRSSTLPTEDDDERRRPGESRTADDDRRRRKLRLRLACRRSGSSSSVV
eukprot:ctg_1373.g373